MDQRKFVEIIKQYPPVWDRSHPYFRDKETKEKAWEEVSKLIDATVEVCKDTFKSIREKYVRERERTHQNGYAHKEWELIHQLRFLDPHIIPRSSFNSDEDMSAISEKDPTALDKRLIHLVKKASPIWDRNSNIHPNKGMKHQLWESIASALDKNVNFCMLRWKALREKYIRQKTKFLEGETKWELLDDMAFLDKVIQYRRRHSELVLNYNGNDSIPGTSIYQNYQQIHSPFQDNELCYARNLNEYDENSFTDSSNDLLGAVKEETVVQVADSSLNTENYSFKRRRTSSMTSETVPEKVCKRNASQNSNSDDDKKEKTAEQLFGDLVANLLSKKPEKERNLYMIEIMTVLSK